MGAINYGEHKNKYQELCVKITPIEDMTYHVQHGSNLQMLGSVC